MKDIGSGNDSYRTKIGAITGSATAVTVVTPNPIPGHEADNQKISGVGFRYCSKFS